MALSPVILVTPRWLAGSAARSSVPRLAPGSWENQNPLSSYIRYVIPDYVALPCPHGMLTGASGCAAQALFLAAVPVPLACRLSRAPPCSHGGVLGCPAALPAPREGWDGTWRGHW